MSENILSAVLTFSLLVGGTAAIGSELLTPRHAPATSTVVVLPQVRVVARQEAPPEVLRLPRVTVIARRQMPTEVASETRASQTPPVR